MVPANGDDEDLTSLHKSLDRLQDELMSVGRHKRPAMDVLRDIDNVETLIFEHEFREYER